MKHTKPENIFLLASTVKALLRKLEVAYKYVGHLIMQQKLLIWHESFRPWQRRNFSSHFA